ncbi:hypothetical protein DAEQUDRAFT_669481 [Daedalea quercina L-15889]|uniref:F-box domain-containing protein n=1 Tax=Daedalea quercina L-15889 TaxID=1314783 RepID=A0A165QJ35_9APHY|nr:hypothetical protein DAEQUDRAFT_669481 [Daedalea quercina L-15889]
MATLPRELYGQVAQFAQWTQPPSLLALTQICKAFQEPAERLLYHNMFLRDAHVTFNACLSLTTRNGERGPYVHKFWFYHRTNRISSFPEQFWQTVKEALAVMVNLETLFLHDPALINTWVLNGPGIKLQLREASFALQWDKTMVDFLGTQERLISLHVEDSVDEGPLVALTPGKLQTLKILSGPPLVVAELLACPLIRLQLEVENETAAIVPTVLLDVGRIMSDLQSLHIVYLPENMASEVYQIISSSVYAPQLHFLGALPYPVQNRHEVHHCLMKLYRLELLELDVTAWLPQPHESYQRMLAAELRTFCPKINYVGFWIANHHFCWFYQDDEWTSTRASGRTPAHETLWRNWR